MGATKFLCSKIGMSVTGNMDTFEITNIYVNVFINVDEVYKDILCNMHVNKNSGLLRLRCVHNCGAL